MIDKKYPSSNKLDPTRIMLRKAGKVFCVAAALIPIFALTLRIVNYPLLLELTPGKYYVTQNPLSSVCFIVLGICLWIVRNDSKGNTLQKIASYIPLIISAIGLIKLGFVIFDVVFQLDVFLFKDQLHVPPEEGYDVIWNEMAPNTAFCFFLLGISIFFIDIVSDKMKRFIQILNYVIVVIALLSLYGYIFKVENLYSIFKEIPMSFYSAICFLLFSSSVLFLRPDRGSMSVVIGETPQEVITLRFVAIVLPLFFGWLKLKGEDAGLYEKELGTAIFAILNYIIIMTFLGIKSSVQHKLRKAKAKIQEIIKRENEKQKRILDSSPTYITIYDLETERVVYYNRAKSLGLKSLPDITEMSLADFIKKNVYEEDVQNLLDRLDTFQNFKDNKFYDTVYRFYDEKGELRWLYSRAIVYKRENGKVKQILTNASDITEQKKAEQELLESKKFNEKIVNTSANIIYIFDLKEYKNIYANRNIETLLGYSTDEIKSLGGELLYSLMHPDDLDKMGKHYDSFKDAKEDEVKEIEYRMKNINGDWIWLHSRDTIFLRDDKGHPKQILGIAHDITNRKENELKMKEKNRELGVAYEDLHQAQEKLKKVNSELEERVKERTKDLKESQEKYRAYIDQSNEGIWRYEFENEIDINMPKEEQAKLILKNAFIAECNDRMAIIHGYKSGKEYVGMKLSDILLMPEEDKVQLVIKFIESKYHLKDVESIGVTKQGEGRNIRSTVMGIVEDKKLIEGWGTQQDITEQKKTEHALMESEKRFHHMLDRIPEIFWCAKPDGGMQYYNLRWYEYVGEKNHDNIKEWASFVHPDDVDRVVELWNDCIENDKECFHEYRLRRNDGEYRWHLISVTPVKNSEGKIVNWLSTSTDIHEQKIDSEELKSINKNLTKITHDVSHDLLDTIKSMEDLMSIHDGEAAKSDRNKEERVWQKTKSSVDKLRKIVTNISEYEKVSK